MCMSKPAPAAPPPPKPVHVAPVVSQSAEVSNKVKPKVKPKAKPQAKAKGSSALRVKLSSSLPSATGVNAS